MRGRLAFALTAITLLFLIQGWSVLLSTVHSATRRALFPTVEPVALLIAALPLLALLAPAMTIARVLDRRVAIAGAAALTAVMRVPMSTAQHDARMFVSAVVVACGALFLSMSVGFLERRSVASGVAAAIVLDQLLRLAGWSWDLSMRTWWVYPQLVVSAVVVVAAAVWLRIPMPGPADSAPSYERRAGGLRLRGALGFGLLMFIDLNVLARAEIATRWFGVPYEAAAVLVVATGVVAMLLLLAGHGPLGQNRASALAMAAVVGAALLVSRLVGGWPGMALFATAHGAALLLLARVLVPAGGRRKGSALVAAMICWLLFSALYSEILLRSGSGPGQAAILLLACATLLLATTLVLLPRPITLDPPLRGRLFVVAAALLIVASAASLAVRQRPSTLVAAAPDQLRVGTVALNYGFDADLGFDPGVIADAIEAERVDVVSLQDTGVLSVAYGVDIAHYLGRRLRMFVHYGPDRGGAGGHVMLSRFPVPVEPTASTRTVGAVDAGGTRLRVPVASDTITLIAARLGETATQRQSRARALITSTATGDVAVLIGDGRRVPWLWTRGATVRDMSSLAAAVPVHRVLSATVLPR